MADQIQAKPVYYYTVYNPTTVDIPPNSIIAVNGLTEDFSLIAGKPTHDSDMAGILITGICAIPPNSYGQAHGQFPCAVAYDPNTGTPVAGQEWGATAGAYTLGANRTGFLIVGDPDEEANLVNVVPWPGSNLGYFNSNTPSVWPNFNPKTFNQIKVEGPYLTLLDNADGTATLAVQGETTASSSSSFVKITVVTDVQCVGSQLMVTKYCLTLPPGTSFTPGTC